MKVHSYIVFLLFIQFCALPLALWPQSVDSSATDAQWTVYDIEKDLYDINLIKFRRLLKMRDLDSTDVTSIHDLMLELTALAGEDKYAEANILLESVILIIKSRLESPDNEIPQEVDPLIESESHKSGIEWEREFIVGSDWWHQEFEFALPDVDSVLIESQANPLIGLRCGLQYEDAKSNLTAGVMMKTSRDYRSAELQASFEQCTNSLWKYELAENIDYTSYTRDIELSYLQNETIARLKTHAIGPWTFQVQDEWRIRRNKPESYFYADDIQNSLLTNARYTSSLGWMTSLEGRWDLRLYKTYSDKAHQEKIVNWRAYFPAGLKWNVYGGVSAQQRDYHASWNDSSFYNDYQEIDADIFCSYRFFSQLQLEWSGRAEWRHYNQPNIVTHHFNDVDLRTVLRFQLRDLWSIAAGHVFQGRRFRQDETEPLADQDYVAHGLEFSMDLFRINSIMFSITDTYLWKRYPNSSSNSIEGFTLYTDRNINSLLLFASWNVASSLDLQIMANLDFDRDPYDDHSDAQNKMFSTELAYSF